MNSRICLLSIGLLLSAVVSSYAQSPDQGTNTSGPQLHLQSQSTTANVLPKFVDSSGTLGDSVVVQGPNNYIGINEPAGQNPSATLHIYGTATQDIFAGLGPDAANGPAFNMGYAGSSFGRSAGFFNVRPDASAVAPNPSLRFLTSNVTRMIITNTGAVGIGLATNAIPVATLDVAGTGHFSGDVTVDGNLAAKYQDIAEWVPSGGSLVPGTVVVIGGGNEVRPSDRAYDTRVAGVVSSRPGLVLGVAGSDKAKVATTGRVKVKVDATRHPVAAGDLLVTSDKPGMAMVSEPIDLGGVKIHRPGTLIGKALEPLDGGEGEILVLLSLQ